MNQEAVRDLVRFALAAAARLDQRVDLGPIHLMKLLFLADWAYAQKHGGETFTDIAWRFHHFGPYCDGVAAELERAVPTFGAIDRSFFGVKSSREVKRWAAEKDEATDELFFDLERILPPEVASAVKRTVETHGGDTYPLLHQVYGTLPMRCSAPGELIDFRLAVREMLSEQEESCPDQPLVVLRPIDPSLSTTQRKRREKAFESLKQRMRDALSRSDDAGDLVQIDPLEDEVFDQGMAWLEPQDDRIHPFAGTLNIHPNVWHSRTRRSIP